MTIEFFIAKKHLLERKKQSFLAILGIAIGIIVLIVSIAIGNGLDKNMINGILSISPHILIDNGGYNIEDYKKIEEDLININGISGIVPQFSTQGILKYQNNFINAMLGIKIEGISQEKLINDMKFKEKIVAGDIDFSKFTSILLGKELFDQLGAEIGDKVQLISAENKKIYLTIVGVFQTGYLEHDTTLAIIPLKTAQIISDSGEVVKNIDIRLKNPYDAYKINDIIKNKVNYRSRTWGELNSTLLKSISLEKTVMIVLVSLIILIAGFVIGVILNMMVREKTKDIGILRSIGYSKQTIINIFLLEGLFLGGIGILLGLIFSSIFLYLIENFLFEKLTTIYYLTSIPVDISFLEVSIIVISAFIIIIFSSFFPALKAGNLNPVEALKYE